MARISALVARQREEMAWELRVRGMHEQRIAEEIAHAGLGQITQQGVSCMLIRLEARVLEAMQERIGGEKARQTDALWLIYEEALQAWERSCRDAETTSASLVQGHTDKDGNPTPIGSGRPK